MDNDDMDLDSQSGIGQKVSGAANKVSSGVDKSKKAVEMVKKAKNVKAGAAAAKAGATAASAGAGAAGGAAGGAAVGAAAPVIAVVLVVIIILIVLIGFLGFLMTMPGMMTGKLKDIAQGVADWFEKFYLNQADALTNEDDIIETANYIKSMGYDLIGYGFIPANELKASEIVYSSEVKIGEDGYLYNSDGKRFEESGTYYDKYGIKYSVGGNEEGATGSFEVSGDIKGFINSTDTSLLRTYIMSDKRMFLIRNYDNGKEDNFSDAYSKAKGDWANGLLSLYKAQDSIANQRYSWTEAGSIKADAENQTLTIKRGWFNNEMKFDMDGWSGRYGLSLEFLLSLHLATLAPELVTTMARNFDTEVQVYLDSVENAAVDGLYYSKIKDDYFSFDEGEFDGTITKKRAYEIMKNCGIESQKEGKFACQYQIEPTVVYVNGEWESANEKSYNDLTTKHSNYIGDVIYGKDDGGDKDYQEIQDAEYWEDIYNMIWKTPEGTENRANTDNIYLIQDLINEAIWYATKESEYLKNKYTIYEDEEGNYTKASDYNNAYYLNEEDPSYLEGCTRAYAYSGTKNIRGFGDIVPFKEFKEVSGSYDNGGGYEFEICTFTEDKDDPSQCRELVISLYVYRTSGDNNWDVMVMAYETPSPEEIRAAESEVCSDKFEDTSITKCCTNCKKYVKTLKKALKEVHDSDFNTYLPYIARVIDSWFRDTYFVIPEDKYANNDNSDGDDDVAIMDAYKNHSEYGTGEGQKKLSGKSIEFIEVDKEYLQETDEYWTKYETYEDGTYKLFVINESGEYETDLNKIPEAAKPRCQMSDSYVLYTDTEEQAEIDGVKVAKKAETTKLSENSWSAYRTKTVETSQIVPLDIDESTSDNIKLVSNYDQLTGSYDEVIYYQMNNMSSVEQVEDGKRGVTNPKIKKMFKIRKYYIYDGTSERAELIQKDLKKVLDKYTNNVYVPNNLVTKIAPDGTAYVVSEPPTQKQRYEATEIELEKALDDFYYGTNTAKQITLENGDPRDPDLIGNISINKDSLSAFSILENTHTLDADYAYRDFKELIVELNYFDKEELSEGKEDVFEWIFPELGSYMWPHRQFDKSEELYGTMLHSREMYDLLEEKEGEFISENTADQSLEDEVEYNNNVTVKEKEETDGIEPEVSQDKAIVLSGAFLEELRKNCEWIVDYCRTNNFSYNVGVPDYGSESILSLQEGKYSGVCCATGVAWALARTSPELLELIDQKGSEGNNYRFAYRDKNGYKCGIGHILEEKFGSRQVTSQSELKPGDVVFWVNKHVQLYLGDGEWFNTGVTEGCPAKISSYDAVKHFYNSWGIYPYAVSLSGSLNTAIAAEPFEGYSLGDAVVAPVTGKIVAVGATEMTNEAINGVETTYEVDYIKIQALSEKDLELLEEKLKENSHEYTYETEKGKKVDITKTDYDAYKDFCEEYEDVCQDYVLTIKGFNEIKITESELLALVGESSMAEATKKVTIQNATITKTEKVEEELPETEKVTEDTEQTEESENLEGTDKEFKINNYTKKETPNLMDESAENEFSAIEDAKFDAQCLITVYDPEAGENVTYIKAGTLIGYTTDANMKLLLRDDKNAIVENVEEYMEINNGETTYGVQAVDQEYVSQSGDLELLANLLHHEGCEAYFTNKLGDQETGAMASRVTGYVLLNRAIVNYGNYGTTIREQILAPGQYSTAYDVTTATADYCDKCLVNAEYCLKYDCSSIISPQNNTPMPRNVVGQSGWCHCNTGKFTCWWWVDTTKDGNYTEADAAGNPPYDTFYCVNSNF